MWGKVMRFEHFVRYEPCYGVVVATRDPVSRLQVSQKRFSLTRLTNRFTLNLINAVVL